MEERDQTIIQKEQEIDRLERELECVNRQLEESKQTNAQFQILISELELRLAEDATPTRKQLSRSEVRINMSWRKGVKTMPDELLVQCCC